MAPRDRRGRRLGAPGVAADDRRVRQRPPRALARRRRRRPAGDGAPVLVAHSVADVARRYDASPDDAVVPMLDALRRLLGLRSGPLWTHAHRWRFASPAQNRDDIFHLGDDGIGLAGDGWGSPRIETAWRSGTDLARAVVERSTQF